MPIREDDNQPNRRFGIINLVLIGFGVLLLFSSFLPNQGMQQVPRVRPAPTALTGRMEKTALTEQTDKTPTRHSRSSWWEAPLR